MYTTHNDLTDPVIKERSQPSDHEEAKGYVDKVLIRIGITYDEVTDKLTVKKLAVTYVHYKRAFYESKRISDIFYKKYLKLEDDLKELTAQLIRENIKDEKNIFQLIK